MQDCKNEFDAVEEKKATMMTLPGTAGRRLAFWRCAWRLGGGRMRGAGRWARGAALRLGTGPPQLEAMQWFKPRRFSSPRVHARGSARFIRHGGPNAWVLPGPHPIHGNFAPRKRAVYINKNMALCCSCCWRGRLRWVPLGAGAVQWFKPPRLLSRGNRREGYRS